MRPYEILADYYSKDWGSWGTQYVSTVSFIANTYNYPIKSVVDIACGIGTLLYELSKHGYDLTGIDLSPEMIERARKLNPDIKCVVGDMATAVIPNQVDCAICSFDSLNYLLSDRHLLKALRNIRRMLKPDGFFAFDINTPFSYEGKHTGIIEREVNGVSFQQTLSYDKAQRFALTLFDFGDGQQELHVQKAYSIQEMKGHLESAGFETLGTYDDFNMAPTKASTYKAVFIARCRPEH